MANLFLHYAFDAWMRREFPGVIFCRYADDAVIHCQTEAQAKQVLGRLDARLKECQLELHPQKTKIVYCADADQRQSYPNIQFTFLGYTFRPRKAVNKFGRVYLNFLPAVSRDALTHMRQRVRRWHIQLKSDRELEDLSKFLNPVLRGWYQYYGRFYSSELKPLWRSINDYLVRWLRRKYKTLAPGIVRGVRALARLSRKSPSAFVHWQLGYGPKVR